MDSMRIHSHIGPSFRHPEVVAEPVEALSKDRRLGPMKKRLREGRVILGSQLPHSSSS
jgi:hypothetical protein